MMISARYSGKAGRAKLKREIIRHRYVYLLMIPGIVCLFIFAYIPIYGIVMAFKDFSFRSGILGSPWADTYGFYHFVNLFNDPKFWEVTRNTVFISLGRILFEFPIPIFLAVFFNELRLKRFKRFTQSVMYFPYFISWVIIGSMVFNLFSYNTGAVNTMLDGLFGIRINFLIDRTFFLVLIFLSSIWKNAGYAMILYLAAITNIDVELYDAATIDGCGRLQKIRYVTLPGISVMITTLLILSVGNIMNAGFDQIFNLYNPNVYSVADIIDTYVYRTGLRDMEFSIGAAVGLFKSIINFALLISVNALCKHMNGTGIYM
jgi:putative aldouronate transport system permease protein